MPHRLDRRNDDRRGLYHRCGSTNQDVESSSIVQSQPAWPLLLGFDIMQLLNVVRGMPQGHYLRVPGWRLQRQSDGDGDGLSYYALFRVAILLSNRATVHKSVQIQMDPCLRQAEPTVAMQASWPARQSSNTAHSTTATAGMRAVF